MKATHPEIRQTPAVEPSEAAARLSKRFLVGSVVFVLGFLSPVLIPLVLKSGLPAAWKTALTGGLAFGIPELAALVAVAILGREGFQDFKRLVWGTLRRAAPPDRVSQTRYRIGFVMFTLPLLFAWLGPYVEQVILQPRLHAIPVLVLGDVLLVTSFVVLGGDFWEKVRMLFVWEQIH